MVPQRLSENLINICIVPQRVGRWLERGTTPAMTSAHDCVDAFKGLVRAADIKSLQVEQNSELSAEAIRERRSMICDKAMKKQETGQFSSILRCREGSA
jgi:hypothetical protein